MILMSFVSRYSILFLGIVALSFILAATYVPHGGVGIIVALAVLIYVIRENVFSGFSRFLIGFLFGLFSVGFSIAWLYGSISFLHESYAVSPLIGSLFITVAFLSAVIPSALVFGMWTLAIGFVRFRPMFDALWIAGSFTIFEFFRLHIVSLILAESGAPHIPHFSFGMVGYALADYALPLQAAYFGGVYMLSFLSVILAACGYGIWVRIERKPEHKHIIVPITVCMLLFFLFFPARLFFSDKETEFRTFGIATEYAESRLPKEMLMEAGKESALIVLPEGSRLFPPFRTEEGVQQLLNGKFIQGPENTTIDSGVYLRGDGLGEKFGVAFSHSVGGTSLLREKEVRTPFGEYVPAYFSFLARILGFEDKLLSFERERTLASGDRKGNVSFDGLNVALLFCHEVALSGFGKRVVKENQADVIVVLASTRWFSNTRNLHLHTIRMAKVQAVQARKPLVRSSFNDPGFVLDAYGQVLFEAPWKEASLHLVSVPIPK